MERIIHHTARVALFSVLLLVFVGAVVRATGSGLGCPDWPTCWGCLIPPWKVEQIDVGKIDLERFRSYASRHGIDPRTITRDSILDSFDPVHTWIEFINRLTSLPLGLSTLALLITSFFAPRDRLVIVLLAVAAFADVLFNAWMGAVVVRSGLKPGIITLHMALAFLLICILTTAVWKTRPGQEEKGPSGSGVRRLFAVSLVFFLCLLIEGILGSQVREQTDEMARAAGELPRREWIGALAQTKVYLVHRSFSWTLLITAALMLFWVRRSGMEGLRRPYWIFGGVIAMMLMGIVLAHVGVFRVVQVLHVGVTAVLLAITWAWLLDLFAIRRSRAVANSSPAS